jgi:hypothetical protein
MDSHRHIRFAEIEEKKILPERPGQYPFEEEE